MKPSHSSPKLQISYTSPLFIFWGNATYVPFAFLFA